MKVFEELQVRFTTGRLVKPPQNPEHKDKQDGVGQGSGSVLMSCH